MHVQTVSAPATPRLDKSNPHAPALTISNRTQVAIAGGLSLITDGFQAEFADRVDLVAPKELDIGDYQVVVSKLGTPALVPWGTSDDFVLGGCYFAPGGNATGRNGGDSVPAFNPLSCWDVGFRPAAPNPRGMKLVAGTPGFEFLAPFWDDIWPLGTVHADGTSHFGRTIADGRNLPDSVDGEGRLGNLNYHTAVAIFAYHGKQLLSDTEFRASAYGVTEKASAGTRSETTALDAKRTSWSGSMMATGQRWWWGHDGDPDTPTPVLLGGSWGSGADSGSRASYWDNLPSNSGGGLGARGRADHLQLV